MGGIKWSNSRVSGFIDLLTPAIRIRLQVGDHGLQMSDSGALRTERKQLTTVRGERALIRKPDLPSCDLRDLVYMHMFDYVRG